MTNYEFKRLQFEYAELWHNMEIKPERLDIINKTADKIIGHKFIYESLQFQTNIPWYFIGLLHLRESNCDFDTHLHNGDPLGAKTVHVPAGRPLTGTAPFSFEYSALDALRQKGYDKITDWNIERIAYCLEKYNGFGYRNKSVNSPYLWASTNNYTKGKYIADGVYNSNVVDMQLGTMAILKVILDKTSEKVVATRDITISPTADAPRPTTKELRQTSQKFNILEWWQWLTGLTAGGTAAVKTLDASNVVATKAYVDTIKSFFGDYGIFLALGILIVAFISINYIMKRTKDDIQEGRYTPSGEK